MLWNPTTDEWEKSFKRYKKQFLVSTLEEITNEEDFFVSRHSIERLYNEQKWENHQRDLYINNDLSSENYLRLKSINFPFTEPYDESNFEIKVIRLIKLIVIIKELHSNLIYDGIKAFVKRFKLSKKNDLIGSIINIEEERAEIERQAQLAQALLQQLSHESRDLMRLRAPRRSAFARVSPANSVGS